MDNKVKLPGEWMDDTFRKFCKDHDISILDLSKSLFILCQNLMFVYQGLVNKKDAEKFFEENEKITTIVSALLPMINFLGKELEKVAPK